MKRVDKRIDESVSRWFGHVERMENDKFVKRVYVGKCAGNRSVGRPQKRWIDNVKECLKKRREVWMSGKQREWWRIRVNGECFVRGNA